MSSTEQAPEPTMDEILASIRKIISDDETGSESADDAQPQVAEAETAAAGPAESSEPSSDGLVDDLANALTDVQDIEAKSAEQSAEDILELTQIVSEQPSDEAPSSEAAAVPEAAAPVDAAMPEASEMPEAAAMPETAAAPEEAAEIEAAMAEAAPAEQESFAEPEVPETSEASTDDSDITALLAEAGVQDMANETGAAAPQESAMPSGDELNVDLEQKETAVADPAPVEDAPISEAVSAFEPPAAEAAPADTASEEAEQAQDAAFDAGLVSAPAAEPQASAETGEALAEQASEQAPGEEAAQAETQAEELLSEPEAPAFDEPVEAAATLSGALEGLESGDPEPASSQDEASGEAQAILEAEAALKDDLPAEAEAAAAEEAAPAEEADIAAASGETRTLEDSVKEMLRPMLREWLDDNMERIVQDEVASANFKSSDG